MSMFVETLKVLKVHDKMGVRVKCPQAVPGQENIPELLATNERQPSENAIIIRGNKAWLSNVSFL